MQKTPNWKPWFRAKSRVFEVPTGKVAWVADSKSRGNALAGFADLRRSYCEDISDELVKQGVVHHG